MATELNTTFGDDYFFQNVTNLESNIYQFGQTGFTYSYSITGITENYDIVTEEDFIAALETEVSDDITSDTGNIYNIDYMIARYNTDIDTVTVYLTATIQ